MGWLRNIFKGAPSSSTPNFEEECSHNNGDSEDDSSSANGCDEENRVIGTDSYSYHGGRSFEDRNQTEDSGGYDDARSPGLYAEVTEEELALDLQQSLRVENLPPYVGATNYEFQPYPYLPPAYRTWTQYGYAEVNDEHLVDCNDNFWNLQGPLQHNYRSPQIADYEFVESVDQTYSYSSDERPYRPPIICDVCKEHVPTNSDGNPKCEEVPIFHQKYCSKHRSDGTAKCFSCERLEPRGTKYSSYNDGRKICGDCKESAIMNRRDCQPLIDEILEFYEDLDMKVWQENIPISMHDKNEMNKDPRDRGITRGITTAYEDPVIKTMIQTPRFGPDNKIIGIKEEPFKLVSHKHVERIQLLNGCPRLYIGRTLAHEMMHAWIRLEGYHESRKHVEGFCGAIPSSLEEAVCQVMAHIWIESKIQDMSRSGLSSSFERKLALHIKHSIETNPDPEYGGASFELAQSVVGKYGLKGMLNYVRLTGSFPE